MRTTNASPYHTAPCPVLTPNQQAILALAGRERVIDRLAHLMGQGKIAASRAGAAYLAFIVAGCFDKTQTEKR